MRHVRSFKYGKTGRFFLIALILALACFLGCSKGSKSSGIPGTGQPPTGYDEAAVELALQKAGANADELRAALAQVSDEQARGMAFLICNMKESDITTIKRDVLVEHVEYAYRAKAELPWGAAVSELYFFHYVMPYRAHAPEPIQKWRKIFFDEICPRVQGMNITEAALEANQWAGSKAQYDKDKVPNPRDPGVLVTIQKGYGYCGELTELYVAAARSICIPARQTSVTKWAGRSDNHAWGEVFLDGQWHFVESCNLNNGLDEGWWTDLAAITEPIYGHVWGKKETVEKFAPVLKIWGDFSYIDVTANYR